MKKNAITIDFENNTAIVTKAFYKAATTFGTREYKMWMECRQQNPDISMKCKTISKNPDKKNDAKNKTYAKMAEHISLQDNAEELMREFEQQKQLAKIQSSPYRAVLAWFLERFPDAA